MTFLSFGGKGKHNFEKLCFFYNKNCTKKQFCAI